MPIIQEVHICQTLIEPFHLLIWAGLMVQIATNIVVFIQTSRQITIPTIQRRILPLVIQL